MALPIDAGKITVGLSGATIEEQHGRGMIGNMTAGLGEAQRMLEAFGSVGAQSFDITWTNTAGDPRRPRTLTRALQSLGGKLPVPKNPDWLDSVHIEGMGIDDLARTLPAMLGTATAERLNLIVRPYGDDVTLMQLDDLDSKKLARVAPAMFLSIERRDAHRRQPQSQTEVRAELSARRHSRSAAPPRYERGRARAIGVGRTARRICAVAGRPCPLRAPWRSHLAQLRGCRRFCADEPCRHRQGLQRGRHRLEWMERYRTRTNLLLSFL